VNEPRNNCSLLEFSLSDRREQHPSAGKARREGLAGVEEQGKGTMGFPGNMGDPNASLGPKAGKDEPAEQHPGLEAVGLPSSGSETAKPTQGISTQGDEPRVGRSAVGSLSGYIVPQTKPANRDRRGSRGVGKGATRSRNRCEET